jgi:hypothetical protein
VLKAVFILQDSLAVLQTLRRVRGGGRDPKFYVSTGQLWDVVAADDALSAIDKALH